MYTTPSHPNESLRKSFRNVVLASPDISGRYWKYAMWFRHDFTSCGWTVLLMDHRLGNQEAKLVRTVFKVRTSELWFKANECILQTEVNASAALLYLFWVLSPNGGLKGNRTLPISHVMWTIFLDYLFFPIAFSFEKETRQLLNRAPL